MALVPNLSKQDKSIPTGPEDAVSEPLKVADSPVIKDIVAYAEQHATEYVHKEGTHLNAFIADVHEMATLAGKAEEALQAAKDRLLTKLKESGML